MSPSLFLPSAAPLSVAQGIWTTGPMCFGNQFIVRRTGTERDYHGHGVTSNHTTDATTSKTMHWRGVPSKQPPNTAMEELLSLTKKPESMALPLAVCPTLGYQIKKVSVANVTGNSKGFIIWNSRQIRLPADEEGKKLQQLLLTWSKGKLFADHSAGSSLYAEEQGAQTEHVRKAAAITIINTLNILPLAAGSFQCFSR